MYSNTLTASHSFRVERKQIQFRYQVRSKDVPLEGRWERTISELIEWFLKDDVGESKARIAQLCAIVAYAD